MWVLTLAAAVKFFPHILHVYDFSPVCVLMWVLRFPAWLKFFPHVLHVYGFSPVCIFMCVLRFPSWLKFFPHILHLYGFSPVRIFMCDFRFPSWLKFFPHILHLYGFSPVCVCVGTAVARWAKAPLSSRLSSLCFTPLRTKFNPRTGQRPYVWKVSSVTCRRSVVSSGYSGFLHQKTDFIIISPPWYDPGCCWGVKPQ